MLIRIKLRHFSLFLILFCLYTSLLAQSAKSSPSVVNGTIDLRSASFSDGIQLNGQWLFYWNQLLEPADIAGKPAVLTDFPAKWTNIRLNGESLPQFGYATYQATILLPKLQEPLLLEMPEVYTAYRLFINGKVAAKNGEVSTSKTNYVPQWQFKYIEIPEGTEKLVLVLQISNFAHHIGGIKKSIVIGNKASMELHRRQTEAIDLLLSGCLLMGGLFFLGLYLMGNRDKAILLFSLFSIVYSYRIVGIDNYVLHTLLPDLSWYLTLRLEYISLFAGIGLFAMYTRYLYPKDVSHNFGHVINAFCISFSLAAILLPSEFFTQLVNPFLLLMLFCLVYTPYVYAVAFRRKRPGAIYTLLSSLSLMVVFTISLLHYWQIIPSLQLLNFCCYISFFFFQSLILSHRVYFRLKQARAEAEQGFIVKSEFLSTMSHEIRTPLNAVIGMSHLLLKNDPREDQVEQLDVMLFSANNLLSIVNDILDYNKIEAGKITFEHIEMDLDTVFRYISKGMKTAADDKGIALTLRTDPALKHKLIGDPTRTTQVVTNLVHNAIKFTQIGSVEVSIRMVSEDASLVTLSISVKDTGIGISEEKQKMIFERFTQADSSTSRSFGGTGLGLAISKRILELQGSTLSLTSQEGVGSTFYFEQTFEKGTRLQDAQPVPDVTKMEEKPLTGLNILLVEDNMMNVLVAQKYLERWGANIDVAYDGLQGLNKLDLSHHDLVLIDLHMPVMDGYEAAKKMREQGARIPIIALTANLPDEIQEQTAKSGIDDIVVKPFLPDELYRKVLHYSAPMLAN